VIKREVPGARRVIRQEHPAVRAHETASLAAPPSPERIGSSWLPGAVPVSEPHAPGAQGCLDRHAGLLADLALPPRSWWPGWWGRWWRGTK
jgi:hypothetical protein